MNRTAERQIVWGALPHITFSVKQEGNFTHSGILLQILTSSSTYSIYIPIQTSQEPHPDPCRLIQIPVFRFRFPSLIKIPAMSSRYLTFYPSNFMYSLPDSCLFIPIPAFSSKFLPSHQNSCILIQIPTFLSIKFNVFSSRFLPFHTDSCIIIEISAFPSKFLHSHQDFHFLIQIPGFSSTFLPPHPASCIFVQINSLCHVIVRMIRSYYLTHNFHAY